MPHITTIYDTEEEGNTIVARERNAPKLKALRVHATNEPSITVGSFYFVYPYIIDEIRKLIF